MDLAEQPHPVPVGALPRAAAPAPAPSLYRLFWRWHFYAGVLVTPVLLVVALTGALYVFKSELERVLYPHTMFVAPAPSRVPLEAQLEAAKRSVPEGYRATRLELSADPTRATAVLLLAKDRPFRRVFVNPHTGGVQGEIGRDGFFGVVLDIHRRLFIGTTGRAIVELVTCWTVVLLLTGAYLWWPRKAEKIKGVVVPRLRGKRYVVLRDLHTVAGFYLLPVVAVIACTGLIYTLVWGSGYRYAANRTGAFAVFTDPPKSVSPPAAPAAPLDGIARAARAHFPSAGGWNVTLPQKPGDAVVVFAAGESGPVSQGMLALDHSTGAVLDHKPHAAYPALGWWSSWNYSLHVGSALGTATKVIWLAACVVLIALPVTGLWMWWTRRPAGGAGLPRRPAVRVPWWLVGAIGLLSLALPALGASVVLILAGEWLVGLVRRRRAAAPPLGA